MLDEARPIVIVGAGPAGLATAACLAQGGMNALVLEAGPSAGTSWRHHYDRLHLHTVKGASGLPGFPFAKTVPRYPSRADVVAYLDAYAAHFALVPRTSEAVRRIRVAEDGPGFAVETARTVHRASAVVVASGASRIPNPERLPDQERFQGELLHAALYRSGGAFTGRRVLVVGAGNSGAELALDLAESGARPTLAVRSPVNVLPRDFLGLPTQVTSIRMRWAPLSLRDALGRMVSRLAFGDLTRHGLERPQLGPASAIERRRRIPLIDVGTIAAIERGAIAVKPGVARLTETGAVFRDGSSDAFDAIVLATGFRPGLEAIVDVPDVLGDDGYPRDWRGGGACPNLYFVGYDIVATGLLRQIALEATAVAADLARVRA